LADGTFAVIHINNLKRAHKGVEGQSTLPAGDKLSTVVKPQQFRKIVPKKCEEPIDIAELDVEVLSHPQAVDGSANSNDSDQNTITVVRRKDV
jgi:hypothetical protein